MRRFEFAFWVCFVAELAIAPGTAWAQSPPLDRAAWIGVKVMPRFEAEVKEGYVVISNAYQPILRIPYSVQDVNGDWLQVGDDRKGWVKRNQVLTLDESPEYYASLMNRGQQKVWALTMRAAVWSERNDLDLAIADYGELLRLAPSALAYNNRGNVWDLKKEYDKAIADYDQAVRLDPKYDSAYYNRGVTWTNKKNYDKATADFDQAIRLNPSNSDAYCALGSAWEEQKDYEKAIANYQRALKIDPQSSVAYNASAWLRATCPLDRYRNGERAVANATKACELTGWADAGCIDTLAAAYAENGDYDSAIKYQNKAIELKPNDAEFVERAKQRIALFKDRKPYREE